MAYEVRYKHKGRELKRPIEAENDVSARRVFRDIVDAATDMCLSGWPIGTAHELFKVDSNGVTKLS